MEVDKECKAGDKPPLKRIEAINAPINAQNGQDVVQCYFCEISSEESNFYDWIGDQSMCKNHKCVCGQVSAVKIFIHSELERTSDGSVVLKTRYVHYLTSINKLKQGKGPLCECSGPLFVQVIPQNEFIIRERITCTYCKKLSRVEFRCDSIKPMAKNLVEGPWTSSARVKNAKQKSSEENLKKYNDSRGITKTVTMETNMTTKDAILSKNRIAHKNKMQSKTHQNSGLSTKPKANLETSNPFSILPLTEDEHNSDLDDTISVLSDNGAVKRRRVQKPRMLPLASPVTNLTKDDPRSNNVLSAAPTKMTETVQTDKEKGTKRYPPFVCEYEEWMMNKNEWKLANEMARSTNCEIRADPRSKKITFFPKSREAYQAIDSKLQENPIKYNYYSHGCKDDRRPAKKLVAKGIHADGYTEDEIKADILTRYGLKLERVIVMKNSTLILIFPGETDMRVARDIKYILCQRATLEKYKVQDTAITQCKRCWQFGHVQSHCRRPQQPESVEQHENGEVWHVCYNCHEIGHTARQAKCPLFQLEVQKQKNRRQAFAKNVQQMKQQPRKRDYLNDSMATKNGASYVAVTAGITNKPDTMSKSGEREVNKINTSSDLLSKAKDLMKSLQAKGYAAETILDFVLELING